MAFQHCNMKKARELEVAIRKGLFPIIVYGPPGSGKTETVKCVLNRLNLKSLYVDLTETKIRKPFVSKAVVFTHIYDILDLNKILYKERTIIESNLAHINKVDGYTLLKFNGGTANSGLKKEKYKNGSGSLNRLVKEQRLLNRLELYRFIGRIFYGKLKTSTVTVDNDCIYVELVQNEDIPLRSANSEIELSAESCSKNGLNEACLENDLNDNEAKKRLRLNFVDSSDQSSSSINQEVALDSPSYLISDECSLGEDFFLQTSFSNEVGTSTGAIPRVLIDNIHLDMKKEGHIVRFKRRKIIGYLYENLLAFSTIDSLPLIYDCFSLLDLHFDFTMPLLGSISSNGKPPKHGCKFRSLSQFYYGLI